MTYTGADDDRAFTAARRSAASAADRKEDHIHPKPAGRGPLAVAAAEPAIPGGRAFSLETVGPGWILYTTRSAESALDEAGVVVEVVHRRTVDADTGEVAAETCYRCYRPGRGYDTVTAADVDLGQLSGLDRRYAGAAARWLLRPVVMARQGKAGQLDRGEIDAIHDAWRLAAAAAL